MLRRILGVAVACLFSVSVGATTVLYVNQNAPTTSANTGTSWPNAFLELRDALNSPTLNSATPANPVEIWVAKGVYKPTSGTNQSVSFQLKSNIRIIGGFAGNETTDTSRKFSNFAILS